MIPWIVTCARCGEDYDENDDDVTWREGEWWCTYEEDCDARIAAAQEEATHGRP